MFVASRLIRAACPAMPRRLLSGSTALRAAQLEDPLQFPVNAAEVDKAFHELVAGQVRCNCVLASCIMARLEWHLL